MNDKTVKIFSGIVKDKTANGKTDYVPLFNITFFVGAGFSKSWDSRFPIGEELFKIPERDIKTRFDKIDYFMSSQGYGFGGEINYSRLKDLTFNLSMQLKYPHLRTRYMDESNILLVLNELKAYTLQRFKEFLPLNYFDTNSGKFSIPEEVSQNQKRISMNWLYTHQK